MCNVHPKLTESIVEQTPRAMIAMLIVSSAYILIFTKFIPLYILLIWFVFQGLLAIYRFYNAKKLKQYLEHQDRKNTHKHEIFFLISNIYQAIMWTIASILAVIYAPQPFELVTFVMIIGIITAAALSMSALYKAYLIFFFLMIIPQNIIMLYYGELQHIGLVVLSLIFIPAIILLSKSIYSRRLEIIRANDTLQKNVEELHKLSIIDGLTNIYNRRYFFEVSKNLIYVALRERKKMSLLMLDIDYFKMVNDTYGHQAGDFILIAVVKDIEKIIRESDIFARFGGEEFTLLLNDTELNGAVVIAEKIRVIIEEKTFLYITTSINITVSIGIAELNQQNRSIEELYKEADKQLYKAKEEGRNRVCY